VTCVEIMNRKWTPHPGPLPSEGERENRELSGKLVEALACGQVHGEGFVLSLNPGDSVMVKIIYLSPALSSKGGEGAFRKRWWWDQAALAPRERPNSRLTGCFDRLNIGQLTQTERKHEH
jgi:hypothetical protein